MSTDEWELRRGGRPGDETISVGERKRQAKGVDLESKFNSPQLLGFQLLWPNFLSPGFNDPVSQARNTYADLTRLLSILVEDMYMQELLPLSSKQRLDGLLYECVK